MDDVRHAWSQLKDVIEAIFYGFDDRSLDRVDKNELVSRLQVDEIDGDAVIRFRNALEEPICSNIYDFMIQVESDTEEGKDEAVMIKFLKYCKHFIAYANKLRMLFRFKSDTFKKRLKKTIYQAHKDEMKKSKFLDTLCPRLWKILTSEKVEDFVDAKYLQKVLDMLDRLKLYTAFGNSLSEVNDDIDDAFDGQTVESVSQYLVLVEWRLCRDENRCKRYMKEKWVNKLLDRLKENLIIVHADEILEKVLVKFMSEASVEELKRLYHIFSGTGSFDCLEDSLKDYISSTVLTFVGNKDDKSWHPSILQFGASLRKIWREAFFMNARLLLHIHQAFDDATSVSEYRLAELTQYLDAEMRSDTLDLDSEEINGVIDTILFIFGSVEGQIVFEEFYTADLATRLLFGGFASLAREKKLFFKIKTYFKGLLVRSEGIINDFQSSIDLTESLHQVKGVSPEIGIKWHVLTPEYWSSYKKLQNELPHELKGHQDEFHQFYKTKHQGKYAEWRHDLGHCLADATFPKGQIRLGITFAQLSVLKVVSDFSTQCSFTQIKNAIGMEDDELTSILHTLCEVVHVLRKVPAGGNGNDHVFILNKDLESGDYSLKEFARESRIRSLFVQRLDKVDKAICDCLEDRELDDFQDGQLAAKIYEKFQSDDLEIHVTEDLIYDRIKRFLQGGEERR